MSRIRSKNTKIELMVFKDLRKRKIYFQKHYSKAPGNPDVALPQKKKAIFINSDFWHGYRFKKWQNKIPREYWQDKIKKNIKRDKRNIRKLKNDGWKILIVWEHELKKKPEKSLNRIAEFLRRD